MDLIEGKLFENIDFNSEVFDVAEYEGCRFVKCNFFQLDISGAVFSDCSFEHCDLGLVKVNGLSMLDVRFIDCKMIGINFEKINPFGLRLDFNGCLLDNASFYKCRLSGTSFIKCMFIDTDFTESDLSGCLLKDCNFQGAIFVSTVLEKSDFRGSVNYFLDPRTNKVKGSRHDYPAVLGLITPLGVKID